MKEAVMGENEKKIRVRAERVDTKCGSIGHMTADEIKARVIGKELNVTCPECGEIHLSPEDVEEAEARKFSETPRYKEIQKEAEEEE